MNLRILLIEDEEEIADFVVRGLAAAMNGSLSFSSAIDSATIATVRFLQP